ncbi:LytR/AlgR family response regulator transcription factor [Chryseobacterium aureum]|uniref:LytR/AlgR family response regulator transcription factor n=1 Tax=Chryseobacterium aureum TaxID=2497456 RepID=UPI003743CBFF
MVLATQQNFISKSKITELEKALSGKGFVRIHRSFVINSDFVTAFSSNDVVVCGHQIPVGRSYKKEFDAFIYSVSSNKLL